MIIQEGVSTLYVASQEGCLEFVQVLIKYGASVNLINEVSCYNAKCHNWEIFVGETLFCCISRVIYCGTRSYSNFAHIICKI